MTWKRSLILASVAGNVLALILPGGWLVWVGLFHADTLSTRAVEVEWAVQSNFGWLAIAIGVLNIACIRFVLVSTGLRQKAAIFVGYWASAAAVSFLGGLIAIAVMHALPLAILAAVALANAAALTFARKKPTPEGICEHCGYDLTGLEDAKAGGWNGVCPECGNTISAK
jgi:hypothetical protein